jgi:2-polyprenyl-3-methyl-5-hydroxy-6-metoxy-1,4-benzoquinol methylase
MNSKVCWCGNQNLQEFSSDYSLCSQCGTLVLNQDLTLDEIRVKNDRDEFYSKKYWLSYQTDEYGYPDIRQRSRQDLPERCLYWLHTLMAYTLPPGRVLELGCAHGGSVALMKWAGFDALGLELSPWVVDFAHQTFDIPMLLGPVEDQKLETGSLDAVVMFDVIEHLPDPVATMSHVVSLLKEEGILIIQTPNYVEGYSYSEMLADNDSFLDQLKPQEHTFLFSHRSITDFLRNLGFDFLVFEPQFFKYDMFFVASRHPIARNTEEQISHNLLKRPSGRLILSLLDQSKTLKQLTQKYQESEQDRQERLRVIEQYSQKNSWLQSQLDNSVESLNQSQVQLEQTRSELAQSQVQLEQTRSELAQSQVQLEQTRSELAQSQAQLEQTRSELAQSQAQLEQTRSELAQSQAQLEQSRSELAQSQAQLEQTRGELAQSQGQLEQTRGELAQKTVNLEEACRQVQDFQQSQRQQLQEELARTEQALEETKQEIAAMKTSKFLKLKAIFS